MKGVTVASYPHELRLDLGAELRLKGISYQASMVKDARIKDYELYVSVDGVNWGEPVARGSFANHQDLQQALFLTPCTARYVRLVMLNSHNGGDFASISELNVILADKDSQEAQ